MAKIRQRKGPDRTRAPDRTVQGCIATEPPNNRREQRRKRQKDGIGAATVRPEANNGRTNGGTTDNGGNRTTAKNSYEGRLKLQQRRYQTMETTHT